MTEHWTKRLKTAALATFLALGAAHIAIAQEDTRAVADDAKANKAALEARVLGSMISLQLEQTSLKDALAEIARQGQFSLLYAVELVPVDRKVSLRADRISVGDALTRVLSGTGLRVVVPSAGRVWLEPRNSVLTTNGIGHQQGTATLTGSVRDSGTGATIPQVTVHIDGTSLSVKSSADGQYKITGVVAGEYRVTARRVGYLAKTSTIILADGGNKKLDFALNPPATQLNEVVTTAIGEQRRYQVGNVISTINVDSIAPNAPVTSVTDLITGRAPGVVVEETSGMVGSGEALRIRGQSSMLLQSDPIIIVDGIREDNTAGGSVYYTGTVSKYEPAPSRINDIDFNEIATITILKGPAATTEYGTDAANGVIVITTKRGTSGSPQWSASANSSFSQVPGQFPNNYWDWGHATDGTATNFTTQLRQPCYLSAPSYIITTGSGMCVVDSITAFNPLNRASTTEYGTGPGQQYNLGVGGGSDVMHYYIAGGFSNRQGVIHAPDVFRSEAQAVGFSNSALNPNSQDQTSLRANSSIRLSSVADVQLNVAQMTTYQTEPGGTFGQVYYGGYTFAPSVDDSAYLYGYGLPGQAPTPLVDLGQLISQQTERWTGGASANWRPASWAAANLTIGVDHEAQTQQYQDLPQSVLIQTFFRDTASGALSDEQSRTDIYTVDLHASATATLFHRVHAITTMGAQYVDSRSQGLEVYATGLSASDFSLNATTSGITRFGQTALQAATAGFYVEENFGVGDRCYVPLALRFDAASGFGADISNGGATYPKYGVTCIVLTGATTLRVRGEFGAAGQQPPYGADLSTFETEPIQAGHGAAATGYSFTDPGNALLQPERSQEYEGGIDLGLWGSRVSINLTAYQKYTEHALYAVDLGWTLAGEYYENIGDVRNTGFEAGVTTILLQGRSINLAVSVNGSINHNLLVHLAPGVLSDGASGVEYFAPGYPLYGYWGDSISYADLNHDGILGSSEIQIGGTPVYQGSSIPTTLLSAAPSLGVWRSLITMSAMFDYEGGFKVYNTDVIVGDRPEATIGSPLSLQAAEYTQVAGQGVTAESFLDGSYLSWRELSAAVALPRQWARTLRVRTLSLVVGVQNLALWTAYPFGDPEVSNGGYQSGAVTKDPASATSTVNNDIRSTSGSVVPLTRQWMLRCNLGF